MTRDPRPAEAALAAVRQQLHAEREAILLLGNENAEMRAELLALRQQLDDISELVALRGEPGTALEKVTAAMNLYEADLAGLRQQLGQAEPSRLGDQQEQTEGNIYIFCDDLLVTDGWDRRCVRGAGHSGEHFYSRPPYPLCPVLSDVKAARLPRETPQEPIIGRLHVLVAELRRCIDDDKMLAAYRKCDVMDELLKELAAARLPAPHPEKDE